MSVVRASFPGSLVLTGVYQISEALWVRYGLCYMPFYDRQRAADLPVYRFIILRPSTSSPFPPKSIVLR
jgi:hypothetical protein